MGKARGLPERKIFATSAHPINRHSFELKETTGGGGNFRKNTAPGGKFRTASMAAFPADSGSISNGMQGGGATARVFTCREFVETRRIQRRLTKTDAPPASHSSAAIEHPAFGAFGTKQWV